MTGWQIFVVALVVAFVGTSVIARTLADRANDALRAVHDERGGPNG